MKSTGNKTKYVLAKGKSFLFVAVFLVGTAVSFSQASAADITVSNVLKLVNEARKSENVAELTLNDKLSNAAQEKAKDMIKNNYFAHMSPDGKTPWYWIDKNGYDYAYAGENLAISFSAAQEQQKAWMDSPLHRKNILNPDYAETGIGIESGKINGQNTTVVVEMFGQQRGAPKKVVSGYAAQKNPFSNSDQKKPAALQNIPIERGLNSMEKGSVSLIESFNESAQNFFDQYEVIMGKSFIGIVVGLLIAVSLIPVMRRNEYKSDFVIRKINIKNFH